MKYWIQTESGMAFDLENPRPDMVSLEDIATALAYTPRFNGHTGTWYSVAEHSVWVSRIVPREDRLWGLLHDAHEAYTGDIVSPMKALLGNVREVERKIQDAICEYFDMSRDAPLSVHKADMQMLAAERVKFFEPRDWGLTEAPADVSIEVWEPSLARGKFLWEFDRIMWGL